MRPEEPRVSPSGDLAEATLAAVQEGLLRTDLEGRVDYLNPAAEMLTGWTAAQALGRPSTEILRLVDENTRKPFWNLVSVCLEKDIAIEVLRWALLATRDGKELPVRASAAPIHDRDGVLCGSVVTFKDMTEIRRMEREMMYLASHDPLTGLMNRREFEKRLDQAVDDARQEHRRHVLCYLDLDEFKLVNDTCGHIAGDQMLRQIADRLQAALRPGDVLARLGGDEFGILFHDCQPGEAQGWAEELLRGLEQYRFCWKDKIFGIGASVGLVGITQHSDNPTGVLSAADAACYAAKERGHNRVHVFELDDTLIGRRQGEMVWVQRIHRALEDDRFQVYAQQIRPLADGSDLPPISELFLRMVDRNGQPVPPAAFIAAAERYHLVTALDRWVVQHAFALLAEDQTGRLFALNLSGQSLGDDSFLAFVVGQIETSGVDTRRICFEVTETAAISNMARARRFFTVLRAWGCRFGLDDFGSGLSSFAYLRDLPVDFLKIDGSFVRRMVDDPVNRELIRAIQQVGKVLSIRTIAESVENEETLDAVREVGVDYAQGYWLDRPRPLAPNAQ